MSSDTPHAPPELFRAMALPDGAEVMMLLLASSLDSVARLSFLPELLAASMIEFHDMPRFSMFMMAVLRFLSSGRPRYLPSVLALAIPCI